MQERFEFYKEYYFRELDRRNQIDSSLSIPIGLITALAGGVSYLLTNFDYALRVWLSILFIVTTGGGVLYDALKPAKKPPYSIRIVSKGELEVIPNPK